MYRVLPHLPMLRGMGWEIKHWMQLFGLLGLKARSKADVTLKDLLSKADAIMAAAPKLKELNAQAQSEAIIRKALDEIDLWGFQRKFELAEARTSDGVKVCVCHIVDAMRGRDVLVLAFGNFNGSKIHQMSTHCCILAQATMESGLPV